jgi:hypothetical protein
LELPPPEDGGLTPPVLGLPPPPELPPPLLPPPPVPPDGVPCEGAGVEPGDGEAVPPPDPLLGVEPGEVPPVVLVPFLFFVAGDDGVVTPPEIGVVLGWKVCVGFGEEPPPPEAIAITTMRKNSAAPPRATSLRRR